MWIYLRASITFLCKGFCLGVADIIPGVSGGTMALVLGIYQRVLTAIRKVDIQCLSLVLHCRWQLLWQRQDLPFLLPLFIGMALALFFFTHIISLPMLLQSHHEQVYGLFFGLIGGVLWIFLRLLQSGIRSWINLFIGVAFGIATIRFIPMNTPDTTALFFLLGALCVCAMLLPGISGSFILLLSGKYSEVMQAVAELRWEILLPFLSGMIIGAVLFSRVLLFLIRYYYQPVCAVMSGLLIASLWKIWPFQMRSYTMIGERHTLLYSKPYLPNLSDPLIFSTIIWILAGILVVLTLHRHSNTDDILLHGAK